MNTPASQPCAQLLLRATMIACLVSTALMAGCAGTTQVAAPTPTEAPAQFKAAGPWQQAATDQQISVPDAWWQVFKDPALDALQSQLVVGNQNLRAALARTQQARAALGGAQAARWPTVSAQASATRAAGGNGANSDNRGGARSTLSVSGAAAWEIDLWGRLSHAADGADARFQASLQDLAAVRLSAQATLTQTYFALRAAEAQQAVIERSIVVYQRSLELTQARHQSGVAPQTDVLQAQTQLRSAQAQHIEAGVQRVQYENAIAVLLGQPPSAVQLPATSVLAEAPGLPALLPSTLLQRRPDIAAAAQRVQAAHAEIGVARAAFFPSITLDAAAGYRGGAIDSLLSAPNRFWSIGPALALALFDGGARRSATEQAQARADEATAGYRQTVLTALQEVEDNLVLADRLRQEAALQGEALGFAQRNLEITQDQYRVGTVSYLNVVTAQTTALASERTLLDLRARQLNATSQLLKNIAGRWDSTQDSGQIVASAPPDKP
ncbi:MAG: efflux transporter outer membrane subunit [Pseudomonadota bacterium]